LSNFEARGFYNSPPCAPGCRAPLRAFVEVLRRALPQRCALCAAPAGNRLVCADCAAALPRVAASCPRCALPTPGGQTCGRCLAAPAPYDAVVAAYCYAFPVDRLLKSLKYGGQLAFAEWAAAGLFDAVATDAAAPGAGPQGATIVPLPLAPERQRQRGFNQAREIARHLARELRLELADVLVRRQGGAPQASLGWDQRRRNVRGAFVATGSLAGGRYALVDDVMTTGATLAEAAATLRRAGAARVDCWVVARTLPPALS
jgi:ComF family protein